MKLVKLKEASAATGLSAWELRKGAIEGRYPHLRVGDRYMFDIETLETVIRQAMEARTCKQMESANV